MASITIKDLPESIDLDHEAMVAITGGARSGRHQAFHQPAAQRGTRIVDYPTGVHRSFPSVKNQSSR
ncbi:hypothetical protein [Noviherbaspirillum saxi]|uniref:Uncharacterized protein n=1 Tax=Noviherbaspirillum saxi TaxID=2320863 RepID=A0A3A3FNJ4_9BURK|nr:hypothetical protein [Noviherbaspirillum saxi]RJF96045.1 hypothetical protein D3871_22155 [Noviherbaspirillum saxi]